MKQPEFDPEHFYPKDMMVTLLLDGLQWEIDATHQHVKLLVERGDSLISGALLNDQAAYNRGWRSGAKRFELQYRANQEFAEHLRRQTLRKIKRSSTGRPRNAGK